MLSPTHVVYAMLNSPVDIAIVAAVALLIFGPKKIPELGRALGQAIGNFKHSMDDAENKPKEKPSESAESDPNKTQ